MRRLVGLLRLALVGRRRVILLGRLARLLALLGLLTPLEAIVLPVERRLWFLNLRLLRGRVLLLALLALLTLLERLARLLAGLALRCLTVRLRMLLRLFIFQSCL